MADLLAHRADVLRDEVRGLASGIASDLWLEKLSVHTRAPILGDQVESSDDLVAMLAGAGDDLTLAEALAADLAPFLSAVSAALPPEADDLRHVAGSGEWHRVAAAAAAGLRARLGAAG